MDVTHARWELDPSCIVPVWRKLFLTGSVVRVVGQFFWSDGWARAVVRVEWLSDGAVWLVRADDCPVAVHRLGFDSARAWAESFCVYALDTTSARSVVAQAERVQAAHVADQYKEAA